MTGAYLAFAGWLQEHSQYKMTGQNRQIVHRGPWNEEAPAVPEWCSHWPKSLEESGTFAWDNEFNF